jgi:hypothetical protein
MTDETKKQHTYLSYFLFIAAALAVFTYLHYLLKEILVNRFYDFTWFYTFSQLIRDGCNLFRDYKTPEVIGRMAATSASLGVTDYTHGISYVPYSLGFNFLVSPFTYLPLKVASLVWVALSQIAFAGSVILLVAQCEKKNMQKILCAIFLIFSFWPLFENVHLAQVNFIILFLIMFGLVCLKRSKMLEAGISLGIAVSLKEIFLPVFLYLVFKKHWKALFASAFTIVAIKAAAILAFGPDKELAYWQHNINYWLASNYSLSLFHISIAAILKRLTGDEVAAGYIQAFLLFLYLVLLVWIWRLMRKKSRESGPMGIFLEFSLFVTLCFLVSPWINEGHFIILYIPLLSCWFYLAENPSFLEGALFATSYLILGLKYSVISFGAFRTGIPSLVLGVKVFGYILLFYLVCRLLKARGQKVNPLISPASASRGTHIPSKRPG